MIELAGPGRGGRASIRLNAHHPANAATAAIVAIQVIRLRFSQLPPVTLQQLLLFLYGNNWLGGERAPAVGTTPRRSGVARAAVRTKNTLSGLHVHVGSNDSSLFQATFRTEYCLLAGFRIALHGWPLSKFGTNRLDQAFHELG